MPRGVPYRVQVTGKDASTYTFTQIAEGTGLSLALISLIMRNKRPVSEYAQPRLAEFFGISIEQLCTPEFRLHCRRKTAPTGAGPHCSFF